MFSSAVLDLAIGLVFCFLTVSLATGTVVEAISSMFKWRANTLRKGIGDLLNDRNFAGLAQQLYDHGAINPRGPGVSASQQNAPKQQTRLGKIAEAVIPEVVKQKPAYIDRQLFANAMMDISGISTAIGTAVKQAANRAEARPTLEALHDAVADNFQKIPNPQLQELLKGIIDRSFGDAEKIRTELSTWFDLSMDRVSGAYKRWTQLAAFIVALILAAGLNIDSITVAKALWIQPKLAEQLRLNPPSQASAPASAPAAAPSAPAAAPSPPAASSSSAKHEAAPATPDQLKLLEQLNTTLPIGWPHGFWHKEKDRCLSLGEFGIAFLGWLITALSTLFGAPFWFDTLQSVIRLKGSGPSPKEKVDGKGGAA